MLWDVYFVILCTFHAYVIGCDGIILVKHKEKIPLRMVITFNALLVSFTIHFMEILTEQFSDGCRVVFTCFQLFSLGFTVINLRFWFFRVDFFTATFFGKRGFGPLTDVLVVIFTFVMLVLTSAVLISQVEYAGECTYVIGNCWAIILPIFIVTTEAILFLRFCFLSVYIIISIPLATSHRQLHQFLCFSSQYVLTGFMALFTDIFVFLMIAFRTFHGMNLLYIMWHLITINHLMIILCYPISSLNMKFLLKDSGIHYNPHIKAPPEITIEMESTKVVIVDGVEYIVGTNNPFAESESSMDSTSTNVTLNSNITQNSNKTQINQPLFSEEEPNASTIME